MYRVQCGENSYSVILLQIVMAIPVTHLVKNHGSQSRIIKSQLKNMSP